MYSEIMYSEIRKLCDELENEYFYLRYKHLVEFLVEKEGLSEEDKKTEEF